MSQIDHQGRRRPQRWEQEAGKVLGGGSLEYTLVTGSLRGLVHSYKEGLRKSGMSFADYGRIVAMALEEATPRQEGEGDSPALRYHTTHGGTPEPFIVGSGLFSTDSAPQGPEWFTRRRR
jgi:hypothetical protein